MTLLGTNGASAAIVTFDTLPGENADEFLSYVEDGVAVSKFGGKVKIGKQVGSPVPSLFFPSYGTILIASGGQEFIYDGADFFSFAGISTISVKGSASTGVVFEYSQALHPPVSGIEFGFAANNSSALITSLMITVDPAATTNIDNISITPMPSGVPLSPALVLLGSARFGLLRRSRADL